MKTSALDKAIAALREQRKPLDEKVVAINLAINALQDQKEAKSQPATPTKPLRAKKAAPTVEPTS